MDFGGAIKRYVELFPLKFRTGRFYRTLKKNSLGFNNSQCIVKNSIRNMIREGFKILGILRWNTLRPHVLRGFFVSTLASDKSINEKEKLAVCRHRDPKTSANYQTRGKEQEDRHLRALLGESNASAELSVESFGPVKPPVPQPSPSNPPPVNSEPSPLYVASSQPSPTNLPFT